MTEDIAKYKKLIESVLNEDYQDRINNLAKFILQHHNIAPFKDKQDLRKYIERKIDWPLGSVSASEVVKDVITALKGQLTVKPNTPQGLRGQALYNRAIKHLAEYAAHKLVDEMGNIFPDGDPHDAMTTVFNRIMAKDRKLGAQASQELFGVDNVSLQMLANKTHPAHGYENPQQWLWSIYPQIQAAFKKITGLDVWDYLSHMHDETYPGQPNPYKGERE